MAVQSVFDGAAAVESASATREKLAEEVAASTSSETTPLTSSGSSRPVIPQRTHSRQTRKWGIFSFLAWPFGFAWNITWAMLSFACKSCQCVCIFSKYLIKIKTPGNSTLLHTTINNKWKPKCPIISTATGPTGYCCPLFARIRGPIRCNSC